MANGRPQIAIVDDDESVRRALARLLNASSFDARTFASGRAFLDSLSGGRPDCVVLDLHMPGLTGLEVLGALAQGGLTLPVVMITGHENADSRNRCLAAGVLAFLGKPLDERELLHAVTKAVAASR